MKIFLSVGNKEIEEMLQEGAYEVLDCEDDLSNLYDLLDYIQIDGLVINRLLDSDGKQLERIAKKAGSKNIKIMVLINDYEDYEERKVITTLINEGVTAFFKFEELTAELAYNTFLNYPQEFDFSVFSNKTIEYRDRIKSVFKEVIAVYSPTSEGSSKVAAHLAVSLARAKECRVFLADYNPLKPRQKEIFDMDFEYGLVDALDGVIKGNLTPERIEGINKQCKYQKNLDILSGLYDINDYYTSRVEQYEEIIDKLKFSYDYGIVDTHAWYDVLNTDAALRKADRVIVVVKGRKYSIEELKRYLDTFEKYNDFDTRKFGIVINQYSGSDLTSFEIEAKIKYPILGYISKHKDYEENAFKNPKLMNEYVDILNAIGIDAKKKKTFKETMGKLIRFKKSS